MGKDLQQKVPGWTQNGDVTTLWSGSIFNSTKQANVSNLSVFKVVLTQEAIQELCQNNITKSYY